MCNACLVCLYCVVTPTPDGEAMAVATAFGW